jgi:hypothetical protein
MVPQLTKEMLANSGIKDVDTVLAKATPEQLSLLSTVNLNAASMYNDVWKWQKPSVWANYDALRPSLPEYRELRKRRNHLRKAWQAFVKAVNGPDEAKKEETGSRTPKESNQQAP